MGSCIRQKGFRDRFRGSAYCDACVQDTTDGVYDGLFRRVDSHFLSIGWAYSTASCRVCNIALGTVRLFTECKFCTEEFLIYLRSGRAVPRNRTLLVHVEGTPIY